MIIWLGWLRAFRLERRRPSNILVQDVRNGGQLRRRGFAQRRVSHLEQEATIVYDTCAYVCVCVWRERGREEGREVRGENER